MKRYFVYTHGDHSTGPWKGDLMVWEGDLYKKSLTGRPDTLGVRYIYDYTGPWMTIARNHVVEIVPAKDLEDPGDQHYLTFRQCESVRHIEDASPEEGST
jgi:hypothetical protein|tara:strand:+ start:400 stop:699 length:300 start_codon:yes stop_codon:yes gene_type:complete